MSADDSSARSTPKSGAKSPSKSPANPPGKAAADPVKDKFREALERKRGHHADREAAADHLAGSKIGESASAKTKRTFRRKSG